MAFVGAAVDWSLKPYVFGAVGKYFENKDGVGKVVANGKLVMEERKSQIPTISISCGHYEWGAAMSCLDAIVSSLTEI